MRTLPAIFVVIGLLASPAQAQEEKLRLLKCIENAESGYKQKWADACYRIPENKKRTPTVSCLV